MFSLVVVIELPDNPKVIIINNYYNLRQETVNEITMEIDFVISDTHPYFTSNLILLNIR
jgi:hypothetical protein